ncbi:MAG: hypothetical protein LBE72_06225 [Rickettsia sp.]|nr:hypothetical protein [Rickettsia sp.]
MQEASSWEVVITSLMRQLQTIQQTLETQNSSVEEYLRQNGDNVRLQLLEAQLKSTRASFERLEDKVQDMIIYLCRAMTVSRLSELQNLLGSSDHGGRGD